MSIDTILSDTRLCPPAHPELFVGGINHPDIFIWDAWSLQRDNGVLSLFTLAQPRASFADGAVDIQTQRDHLPHHWRRFDSTDDGQSWRDHGPVFAPALDDSAAFDSRSIWTGSALAYEGQVIAGYTGIRQMGHKRPFLQSLGLAVENPATGIFERISNQPLLCPQRDYDLIQAKGYYLGDRATLGSEASEADGNILAWRDPSLLQDKTGALHMFWGAKAVGAAGIVGAIGHGVLSNAPTAPRLELLPPIMLADAASFTQAEVPQLVYDAAYDRYLMMVSTTNRTSGAQTDADLNLEVRLYQSPTIAGVYELANIVLDKSAQRYPGVIIGQPTPVTNGSALRFTAPYNRGNGADKMHTMPPLSEVVI